MSPTDRPTLDDLEQLSRWLDGELPDDEAAALEARLAGEPTLQRALAELTALPEALARLPRREAPPRHLDAAVVAAARAPADRAPMVAPTPRAHTWAPLWALGGALAAAAALAVTRPAPTAHALVEGTTEVDGEALVQVAGATVAVDGRARIAVEPIPDGARGVRVNLRSEDPSMNAPSAALAGAAAGALLTVAVYEGTATITPDDEGAVSVSAGGIHTTPLGAAAGATPAAAQASARPQASAAPGSDLARAQTRITELEDQVAALTLHNELQRGALEQSEGTPQAWPSGAHSALREPALQATLDAFLTEHPDVELLGLDCAEYPCVAMLEAPGDASAWTRSLHEGLAAHATDAGLEEPGVGVWVNQNGGPDEPDAETLVGVALVDGAHASPDNEQRTNWRVESWTRQLRDEPGEGGGDIDDVDVVVDR